MIEFLIVVACLIGAFIIISMALAIGIIQFSVRPLHETREHAHKNCVRKGYLEGTENFKREPIEFVMKDGYVIHADISMNDPKKVMVVCHGHCGNRETVLKYARIFFKEGYSIVLYDQRGHGDNKRTKCLMGKQEHLDFLEIIAKVRDIFPKPAKIGVFGVSMGGSFVMMGLKQFQDLDFCVIDCSFASVEDVFKDLCVKRFKFPSFLSYAFAKFWIKLFHRMSFNDIQPYKDIENNHVPMLFIHGSKDPLIYPHNQLKLVNSLPANCYKEAYIFKGAKHDNSVNLDPEQYHQIFKNFIKNIKQ